MNFVTPQEMLKLRLRHQVKNLSKESLLLIKENLDYFQSEHGYLDLFTDKDNTRLFFSDERDIDFLKIKYPDLF